MPAPPLAILLHLHGARAGGRARGIVSTPPTPPLSVKGEIFIQVRLDGPFEPLWLLEYLGSAAVVIVGQGIMWIRSFFEGSKHVKSCYIGSCLCVWLLGTINGALFALKGNYRRTATSVVFVLPILAVAVGISLWETHAVKIIALQALLFSLALGVINGWVLEKPFSEWWLIVIRRPVVLLHLAVAAALYGLYLRALRRARRVIAEDLEHYSAVWDRVVADPAARGQLADLKRLTDDLHRRCPPHSAAQCGQPLPPPHAHAWPDAGGGAAAGALLARWAARSSVCAGPGSRLARLLGGGGGAGAGAAGALRQGRPVESLDQLFVAARCLHPFLIEKVKAWAWASDSFVLVQPRRGQAGDEEGGCQDGAKQFERFRLLAAEGAGGLSRVRWAKVKQPTRAMEKVVRSYCHDVSRLLDLVRQSLVFDQVLV